MQGLNLCAAIAQRRARGSNSREGDLIRLWPGIPEQSEKQLPREVARELSSPLLFPCATDALPKE